MSKLRTLLVLSVVLGWVHAALGQTILFDFESGNQGWGSFGTITTDSGETLGSSGVGRFHTGDYSADDLDPTNPLLWGIVNVSQMGVDLSPYSGFSVDALLRSVPGFPDYTGDKLLDIGIEVAGVDYFADPVTMIDTYQTFSVRFVDFMPSSIDRSSVQIKLRVLSSFGMGIGELNYDEIIGLEEPDGDYDDNGLVGAGDLSLTLGNWGQDASVTGVPDGWINNQPTGLIGAAQLSVVLSNWGNTASVPSVPEPSSIVLVLLGWAVLARRFDTNR